MEFKNEYFFLSNFYPCNIRLVLGGKECKFLCAESAYQAQKNIDIADRFSQVKGLQAHRDGRRLQITTPNWNTYHLYAMSLALHEKFNHKYLLYQLKNIKEEIIFDAPWGDIYWGVCKGIGKNILGKILMRIRDTDNNISAVNSYITEVLQKEILYNNKKEGKDD